MKNGFHEWIETIEVPSVQVQQKTIEQCHMILANRPRKITKWEFFISQRYYMKSMFWFWQVMIIVLCYLFSFYCIKRELYSLMHFIISFSVIIIHMVSLPMLLKSIDCETIEVENVTFISYRFLLISRIVWMSLCNLFFMSILMFFTVGLEQLSLEQVILYMLVPYNITCLISFIIMYFSQHVHSIYACIVSNIFFSILLFLLSNTKFYMVQLYRYSWRILFLCSLLLVFIAIRNVIKQIDRKEHFLHERRISLWN